MRSIIFWTASARVPRLVSVAATLLAVAAPSVGQIRLAHVFGDHMVLQRDEPVAIWGQAPAGERVRVRFGGQSESARAGDDGWWSVRLPPLVANAAGRELIVEGKDQEPIVVTDVVVGEVWICGGQSNMEWKLRGSRDADLEVASADYPGIRFLRLPHVARKDTQRDIPVAAGEKPPHWRLARGPDVGECTAVGYYFARRLHRSLRVPVGLVDTSWGGTMAQHWVSKETLGRIDRMKSYFKSWLERQEEWDEVGGEEGAARRFDEAVAAWQEAKGKAAADGKRAPRRPRRDAFADPSTQRHPGGMFAAMIAPIAAYTVRGVLFYQGENNAFGESWKPFPVTFPAVISDWRTAFGKPKLPFGLIQIAGWSTRRSMTYDMNHHTNIVREVQHRVWETTEHTGLIVTYDANSNGNIHPRRKLPVGGRSARWALSTVYQKTDDRGRPIAWRGPVYESIKVTGKRILVSFSDETDDGLRLDQDAALGFYVAGEDRVFHIADARVRKRDVEVWSDAVKAPVAVRYAWSNLPLGTLLNGRELPAYPFRSDDWPLVPHQSTGSYELARPPREP
ncbi:MAG: hypothetical protein CMJ83_01770 [Planctomycetes bacterium]|nr:hypothetical protein [Planctomycetota bacterium]